MLGLVPLYGSRLLNCFIITNQVLFFWIRVHSLVGTPSKGLAFLYAIVFFFHVSQSKFGFSKKKKKSFEGAYDKKLQKRGAIDGKLKHVQEEVFRGLV